MSYTALTTVEDLQAFFPGVTFSVNTKPTLVQVTQWIQEATAIIYGALYEIYLIPVTDADDLYQLKVLANIYCVAYIEFILGKNRRNDIVANSELSPRSVNLDKFYSFLKKYKEGDILLVNTANSSTKSSFYSYNEENDISFVAQKETAQW